MSALFEEPAKLSLARKFSRLADRMRDPEWRRFGRTLLLGKALGLVALVAAIFALKLVVNLLSSTTAYAEAATAIAPMLPADLLDQVKNPVINPINTMWVLLGAFLVFGMQAGFTMLEAGMCRNRETVNVLVECVFDTCVCGFCTGRSALRSCSVEATHSAVGICRAIPPRV
jgi:Amt family ammonium transporter